MTSTAFEDWFPYSLVTFLITFLITLFLVFPTAYFGGRSDEKEKWEKIVLDDEAVAIIKSRVIAEGVEKDFFSR